MTRNYSEETTELKEPNQTTIDFILNYSKALYINEAKKKHFFSILN